MIYYVEVIEFDEKQFRTAEGAPDTGLDGRHYNVVEVQWVISGRRREVEKSNTNIADFIEERHPEMKGLKELLYSNLMRFWEGGK